ncbi:hypothetical protein [uncultured Kordia sp.]|uniref:hypothetical protein n=1 Tax=uncultured Kordia sp. TaxID=507699 RepID=UPI0026308AE0|nr:hypothetical protein [uncultured Kordia sp.]
MKKRTIKSLELNKKTISILDSSKVKGGSTAPTSTAVYTPVMVVAIDAALDAITDFFD